MLVFVKTLYGKTLEMHMEKWETVADLKEKIYDKEGIVPDNQRFLFSGWQLEDEKVFYDTCVAIRTSEGVPSPTKIDGIVVHLVTLLRGGGNGLYHHPVWNDQNPSGSDDSSDSDLDSDHLLQNGSHESANAIKDGTYATGHSSIKEQEEWTKSSSKGKFLVSRENPTVDDPSTKEQEERTQLSSKGSRGPRRSIINKQKKWSPWNCFGFAAKQK